MLLGENCSCDGPTVRASLRHHGCMEKQRKALLEGRKALKIPYSITVPLLLINLVKKLRPDIGC